jgi:hypothetical protein
LCILLWIFALAAAGFAIWFFIRGLALYGGLTLLIAGLLAASGIGLYLLRRWGVVLFGLLAGAGSINHLSRILFQYSNLSANDLVGVLGALISILAAIALPVLFIYLVLVLWKQTH